MKTKLIIVLFTLMNVVVFAQVKKQNIVKKSEIIEKSVNEKGDTVVNKEVKVIVSGDKKEEMDEEVQKMVESGKDGEFLSISKQINNGKEQSTYTLLTIKDGKKSELIWDGTGEMPEAIKNKMTDMDVSSSKHGDQAKIIIEKKVHGDSNRKDENKHEYYVVEREKEAMPESKVKLGVMIDDTKDGVRIQEVFKGGAADKAGLEPQDVVVKINDKYIFSTDVLMEVMRKFDVGDKAKIIYIRGDKEKSTEVKF